MSPEDSPNAMVVISPKPFGGRMSMLSLPTPPQLAELFPYVAKLPPVIAREAVAYFTGGVVSPKTLANDDSLGQGPLVRQKIAGKVAYPTVFFLAYLERQGVTTIVTPKFLEFGKPKTRKRRKKASPADMEGI
jgi:hypothetical protein